MPTRPALLLATRRGKLLLLLLCAVQFLDVVDSSIMNVALPSIRRDLGFSAQDLQWVLSGYLVTYGGLLLLGGRAGDLPDGGGCSWRGPCCSPPARWPGGRAADAGMLVGARLGQGAGAAPTALAGLSILTTRFNSGDDRNRALGVWVRSPACPRRPGCSSAACCPALGSDGVERAIRARGCRPGGY